MAPGRRAWAAPARPRLYLNVPAAGFSIPFPVPDLSVLCGVSPANLLFYVQLLQIDVAAAQGVSFTPGLKFKLGK